MGLDINESRTEHAWDNTDRNAGHNADQNMYMNDKYI